MKDQNDQNGGIILSRISESILKRVSVSLGKEELVIVLEVHQIDQIHTHTHIYVNIYNTPQEEECCSKTRFTYIK